MFPWFHHSIIPLFHHSTLPPFHSSTIPPFQYSIIPAFHSNRTSFLKLYLALESDALTLVKRRRAQRAGATPRLAGRRTTRHPGRNGSIRLGHLFGFTEEPSINGHPPAFSAFETQVMDLVLTHPGRLDTLGATPLASSHPALHLTHVLGFEGDRTAPGTDKSMRFVRKWCVFFKIFAHIIRSTSIMSSWPGHLQKKHPLCVLSVWPPGQILILAPR